LFNTLEEVFTVRTQSILAGLAVLSFAGGSALAALPPQPVPTCTIGGTITIAVTMVYDGATAPNPSILASATNLFVGGSASEPAASGISLIFDGDLQDQPDFRPGKTDTVHRQIQIANLTLTITKSDGSAVRVTGGALFYLVRGDSAVIPQELKDRGFTSDNTRWYIERWEDQTNVGAGAASVAPALGAGLSTNIPERMTWGLVKRDWLGR